MSYLYGSLEALCDGCGSCMPCTDVTPILRPSPRWPTEQGARVLTLHAIAAPDAGSNRAVLQRFWCPTCARVAEDVLRETFPRLPVVINIATAEDGDPRW